jgi:malonate-semialdehyde dehydrogenase (acetylating)/methylmalonate-semialdehyde dehydrogenase
LILPDADPEMTTKIVTDSVFGNAGQRCLAASLVVTVGDEAKNSFVPALIGAANDRSVGYGLEEGIEMGPVITPQSKERIIGLIQKGVDEGANLLVDGRKAEINGYEGGNFLRPTILENVAMDGEVVETEIFGPVMGLVHVQDIDEAIAFVNRGTYGNMACLFTSSGSAARKFRNQAEAGNIGINIGVAAPMAFFPFSGWKESFFGTLHGQSNHAVEFYTQTKVVVERWPREWSRKF